MPLLCVSRTFNLNLDTTVLYVSVSVLTANQT